MSKRFEDVVKWRDSSVRYCCHRRRAPWSWSRSVRIYQKYLTDTHLVILKHIGHMNTGASSIAVHHWVHGQISRLWLLCTSVESTRCQLQRHFLDHAENQMSHGRVVSISSAWRNISMVWSELELTLKSFVSFLKPIRLDGNSSARHQWYAPKCNLVILRIPLVRFARKIMSCVPLCCKDLRSAYIQVSGFTCHQFIHHGSHTDNDGDIFPVGCRWTLNLVLSWLHFRGWPALSGWMTFFRIDHSSWSCWTLG
jgi:hypothetical protein